MKITGNEPAMPRPYSHDERPSGGCEGDRPETFPAYQGLTIRQYFAAMALQGFISSRIGIELSEYEQSVAECSVRFADALIKELNRSENENTQAGPG